MNFMFLLAFVAVGAASILPLDVTEQWENYKKKYGKNYNSAEELDAQDNFKQSMSRITEHNRKADLGLSTFWEGVNKYSDMAHDEFVKVMNGFKMNKVGATKKGKPLTMSRSTQVPNSVNWTEKGYVTPVKDQGQCGSCYSFSATGALEGQFMNKTGKLVSLSEQNVVDCSTKQGNYGCDGGLMDYAFQFVVDNKGIATENSYPYLSGTTTIGNMVCLYKSPPMKNGGSCSGYYDLPSGDENALKIALATIGPISVAIDASAPSFQNYKKGVYNEPQCSSEDLDHGVLVVGYGTTQDGQDYWLIKNSWGTSWGMNGYMMMARNKNNHCGIATMASYPIV